MVHTILIQDDADLLRTLDGGLVQRRELRVLLAPRGAMLVDRYRRHAPDLVILDQEAAEDRDGGLDADLATLAGSPDCVVVRDDVHHTGTRDAAGHRHDCRRRIQASICSQLGLAERAAERRPIRVPTRIESQGAPAPAATGTTRDVSAGGAYVVTSRPLPDGTEVRVRFRGHRLPEVRGRIVRVVGPGAGVGALPGMAVRFNGEDELTGAQIDLLERTKAGAVD